MSTTTLSPPPDELVTPGQVSEWSKAVRQGLLALFRPEPLTAVEWADRHFYLSSESSYHEGRWTTLPFQIAILNSMGNDEIRTVNVVKSARLGYTKMLLAAAGYLLEHKKRNILTFSPTDTDAESFMKTHLETMVRDVPVVLDLAPWHGMKHRDNTLSAKRFANGKQVFVHGGKAARNYREKSVDVVIYDELAAFDEDIEKEGSPTTLGDKRLEGSTFPKSIRGSTPKVRGQCQIEAAAEESPHRLHFHVPCPHCGERQVLKWGGPDTAFGIKWDKDHPETAFYQCEHNGCVIRQHELQDDSRPHGVAEGVWICEATGISTRDGIDWFDAEGEPIPTPDSVTFYLWTVLSPFTTWERIVRDFLKAKDSPGKLKTFVNTTLGETWEDELGEKLEWETIFGRREVFPRVPEAAVALFGGIDTQDDRYEGRVWAFGPDEEAWLVDRWILYGDPAGPELKRQVANNLRQSYQKDSGEALTVTRWCWDSGGHYTDEVYEQSKQHGLMWVIPIRGANVYGKPIANFPRKRNAKGVYLTEVGTDNAKELIYNRLKVQPQPGKLVAGCVHLPANDEICDEDEVKQMVAEIKVAKIERGQRVYRWDSGGRRNEALDCLVYALTALRISQQRFGLDLNAGPPPDTTPPDDDTTPPPSQPPPAQPAGGGWLQLGGGWM
ncbi:phage terminase large subunit family protein [Halomonas salina]|uniref:phage terminase large subunit family protein n=1 Tax=Halomonas salina TaxID=42565 RepID=UPI0009DFB116|nr:terminase gpA endonuclease subunit [Halomonas salina]